MLLLLMLIAFNLVNDFEAGIDEDDIRKDLGQSTKARVHAVTLRLIVERIIDSLEASARLVSNG